jgi:hypothetical protein
MSSSISQRLDAIAKDTFSLCSNDKTNLGALNAKVADLAIQIRLIAVLEPIARLVRLGEPLSVRKLNFNIKKLSEEDAKSGEGDKSRWISLQRLGCEPAIFCMISFNGLALLHAGEFTWLIDNIGSYMETQRLPPGWIAREQIRKSLANTPRRENVLSFLESIVSVSSKFMELIHVGYHTLEIRWSNVDVPNFTGEVSVVERIHGESEYYTGSFQRWNIF